MKTRREVEFSEALVIVMVKHLNHSIGSVVQLMKKELSLDEFEIRQKESYENIKRLLNQVA